MEMFKKTPFYIGLQDIVEALHGYWLPCMLAWQDISIRYKRSRLGQFWLTINTLIYISTLGIIFGSLFRFNLLEYLPNISASVLMWNFMNASITEGSMSFISSENIILQVKLPFFTYIIRTLIRNFIAFCHNIVIFPFICLCVGYKINFYAFLSIFGLLIVFLNLSWICIIAAVFCTRFRDLQQIIISIMQILFYVTPVVWSVKAFPPNFSPLMLTLNPFYNFINVVKMPLLGYAPAASEWMFCCGLAVVGWCAALYTLGKYKRRIAYWL
ncbi:hypothetical protein B9K05_08360 [Acetobacter syzygii]|jgi:lipopolysaccharide transport system permease protein|uniref:ABC-2 type transporter transmembrane domain-containing protein n=3 Tax=Acetobacter syzygii TaxID=146476 RepID=A0A270BL30_9PROT|nr:hypothetical protein B9K05_08360 [Acetobacter syzygii]PAL25858.1 hypothetical protein B9K04_07850 [Acetobacter syzygii]GAN70512.1 ABC transporter [Acetobacter syzygii]